MSAKTTKEEDIDLDELLEDALEDFQKPVPGAGTRNPDAAGMDKDWTKEFSRRKQTTTADTPDQNDTPPNSFVDPNMFKVTQKMSLVVVTFDLKPIFLCHQAAFERHLRDLESADKPLEDLGRRSEGLRGAEVTPPNSYADPSMFKQRFEKHLKDLETGGKPLEEALKMMQESTAQGPPDLDKLLSSMSLDPALGAEGSGPDLMPMMDQMMKSLLSKDLLYPAIR